MVVQATDMKLQAEIMAKVQAARERARRKVEKHNTQRETGKREETEKLAGGQIAKQAERRMETVFDRKQESEEANKGDWHASNSESGTEDVMTLPLLLSLCDQAALESSFNGDTSMSSPVSNPLAAYSGIV